MTQLIENDPVMMKAAAELRRFSADPDMRELERRRKLWKLEYYSGIEAARAEGEARGEARGRIQDRREMVLMVLQARFGKVPADIEKAVNATTDLTALKSLAAHSATCASLDDFSKRLP